MHALLAPGTLNNLHLCPKEMSAGEIAAKIKNLPMKLFIVEDEKVLSDSILQYLTRESFICEVADSYAGALKKIESFDYDCILLDITLKDGRGPGLLRKLMDAGSRDPIQSVYGIGHKLII